LKKLVIPAKPTDGQKPQDRSFLGGTPALPEGVELPTCSLCGSRLTFFFQLAFPDDHVWRRNSLAVFACTSCADESYFIPEMLSGPLHHADIPSGFLEAYQRNFRFVVFPTDDARPTPDYAPAVLFKRLSLVNDKKAHGSKVGGAPDWILEDESPGTYAGAVPLTFLLQLEQGLAFETVDGAENQMTLGLDGKPKRARSRDYDLFLRNALYLFGTVGNEKLVYAITQVD